MKFMAIAAGLGGALLLAGQAAAADHEAGVPLTPSEAAGGWTLSSGGQPVCMLTLGARHTVRASSSCASALPGEPTGWAPTADGMRLVGADGQTVVAFDRWSNSLFVSRISGHADLQLRRGS
jgi:hypothetical protein